MRTLEQQIAHAIDLYIDDERFDEMTKHYVAAAMLSGICLTSEFLAKKDGEITPTMMFSAVGKVAEQLGFGSPVKLKGVDQ